MKRILIALILSGMCLLSQTEDVGAEDTLPENRSCNPNVKDKITFEDGVPNDTIGISAHAEKIAPSNPIVIGQDLVQQRGVDLSVTIIALKGKAVYWRWEDEWVKMEGTFNEEHADYLVSQGGYKCSAINSSFYECYEKKQVCKSNEDNPEIVYRYINPDSVSIWLDPTTETEQFLGWTQGATGQYPLRYLFPEKWALGAYTPEGMEQGDIGKWTPTGEEVWTFGQENPWFTFLFPDPNEKNLPGQHLFQMSQPVSDQWFVSRRILALYGPFFSYQSPYTKVEGTYARDCLIDAESLPGDGNTPPSAGSCTPGDNYSFSDHETIIIINFNQIPLDMPGEWRIGIKAEQSPAKYDVNAEEEIEDSLLLKFGPSDYGWTSAGYDISSIYFTCYVVVSTPCGSMDPDSCEN